MAFFDAIKREFRSVIEWENPKEEDLFYRWSDRGDEIKNASKLMVSPSQGAIFIYEGKIVAIFDREGIFDIKTSNIPFITTLKKFMQFFESEHKTQFYFYRKNIITDQKWGTISPIKYIDPLYKFPIELMAFGNYSFKIENPKKFFISFVGNKSVYTTLELKEIINARLSHTMGDFFAESKFSYVNLDENRDEIVEKLENKLQEEFLKFGLKLIDFRIEGTNFSQDTKKRIDKIADVEAAVYAAKRAGIDFKTLRELDALNDAAKNEAGASGVFMGANVGNSLSLSMEKSLKSKEDPLERLKKLKEMYDLNLIEKEEFLRKKEMILKEL